MKRTYFKNTYAFAHRFKDDSRGSMTVFGLFFFVFSGILGAIALDIASLYSDRHHLQTAADQAAHAAIYNHRLRGESKANARTNAVNVVNATLPLDEYGISISTADIEFGTFQFVDGVGVFTEDETAMEAARAVASFSEARSNPASTYLFRLIGLDAFDVVAGAVFYAEAGGCEKGGFFSNTRVEMQNNNAFGPGLCVHSNGTMKIQPNNNFDPKMLVTLQGSHEDGSLELPDDMTTADIGDEGFELDGAFSFSGAVPLNVLNRVDSMINDYVKNSEPDPTPGDAIAWPDYVIQQPGNFETIDDSITYLAEVKTGNTTEIREVPVYDTKTNELNIDGLDGQTAYTLNVCSNGGNVKPIEFVSNDPDADMNQILLVTDCPIKFGPGVTITESRIVSTYYNVSANGTIDNSITATSGFVLGRKSVIDGSPCQVEGSGVQLATPGSINFTAQSKAYGSQIFAGGDVGFTSNGSNDDVSDYIGTEVVADGKIDMQSNMIALQACPDGGLGITAQRVRLGA